ncbi:MAG: hypothetical protein RL280_396, partial [Actinomycetota bacterium]
IHRSILSGARAKTGSHRQSLPQVAMGITHSKWQDEGVNSPQLGLDALRDMRGQRRRHRVEAIEWFEALYRVYLAAFMGGGAILFLSSVAGDEQITGQALRDVTAYTPHVVGFIAALVVFIGLRSGANGGPIAVEEAEVRHVLLSPIEHAAVLRHPAIQRLRTFAFAGAIAGGTANQLLGRRITSASTSLALWALYGAIAGALLASLFVVAALLIHALAIPRWATTSIGVCILAWQGAVTFTGSSISGPFDFIGSISRWWLNGVHVPDLVAIVVVLLITAVAVSLTGRLSLEALSRRSSLVSQLKFAVTLQDIRTVVLLRRQLSQEHMRVKPWVKVPSLLRRDIVVGRGFRSIAHFPLRRIIRMKLLTISAAGALVLAYRGTTPAIVVAGLLLFVVGLDAVEPLSQEVDQPDRTDALPVERGLLMTKHLIVPAVVTLPFLFAGVFVAVVLEPAVSTVGYAFLLGIPALLGGVAGASINAVKGAPDPVGGANEALALPPEMSGIGNVIRAAWPPTVAIVSCAPVLALRISIENNSQVFGNTLRATLGVFMFLTLIAGWVRQRDAIHKWFRNAQQQSKASTRTESI